MLTGKLQTRQGAIYCKLFHLIFGFSLCVCAFHLALVVILNSKGRTPQSFLIDFFFIGIVIFLGCLDPGIERAKATKIKTVLQLWLWLWLCTEILTPLSSFLISRSSLLSVWRLNSSSSSISWSFLFFNLILMSASSICFSRCLAYSFLTVCEVCKRNVNQHSRIYA